MPVFGVMDLPTYLTGLVLIVLLPGPNSLYVVSVAARRGVRAGYTAAAGVWCGDAVLFGVVQYAGAGYLTWLAVGMLRAASDVAVAAVPGGRRGGPRRGSG